MKTFRAATRLLAALASLAFVVPAPAQEGEKKETKAPEKLVIAFQKQKDPKAIQKDAEKVADVLSKEVGIPVEVMVPSSYGAAVQALISGKAQAAYVEGLPFMLARKEAPVELILAEVRNGRTDYDSIFVVKKDSPYQKLEDLKGKRVAFTSPTSTSGYVMALGRLVQEDLMKKGGDPKEFFGEVSFGGGYDKALLAVLNDQADVAAVSDYTMSGPKADVYLKPEQREQLRILTRTPGVPTHGIAVRSDLPEEVQAKLKSALLKLSSDNPELLADVYGASKFVESSSEQYVSKIGQALENSGLSLDRWRDK